MTIVDIIGIMYFWDLTLDSVTAVNLVLAVGFSVDYTAHIAHCFMVFLHLLLSHSKEETISPSPLPPFL